MAGLTIDRFGFQLLMPLDGIAVCQRRLAAVQLEFHNSHRRQRGLIMRVEHAEEGVGHLGEIVIELVANPRGEKGEGLNQPLDVGILRFA